MCVCVSSLCGCLILPPRRAEVRWPQWALSLTQCPVMAPFEMEDYSNHFIHSQDRLSLPSLRKIIFFLGLLFKRLSEKSEVCVCVRGYVFVCVWLCMCLCICVQTQAKFGRFWLTPENCGRKSGAERCDWRRRRGKRAALCAESAF